MIATNIRMHLDTRVKYETIKGLYFSGMTEFETRQKLSDMGFVGSVVSQIIWCWDCGSDYFVSD